MLEVLLLLLFAISMAKHGGRRGSRRYSLRKVRTIPQITVGTLATITVVVGALAPASTAAYRLISCAHTWSLSGHTAGEGPYSVGYAFGDYSVAEIKESIEIANSISPSDKVAQEKANRWVRHVGTFSGAEVSESLNDGKVIKTRLNWFVPIGSTVNAFLYNEDLTANQTTGSLIDLTGNLWVKDT